MTPNPKARLRVTSSLPLATLALAAQAATSEGTAQPAANALAPSSTAISAGGTQF